MSTLLCSALILALQTQPDPPEFLYSIYSEDQAVFGFWEERSKVSLVKFKEGDKVTQIQSSPDRKYLAVFYSPFLPFPSKEDPEYGQYDAQIAMSNYESERRANIVLNIYAWKNGGYHKILSVDELTEFFGSAWSPSLNLFMFKTADAIMTNSVYGVNSYIFDPVKHRKTRFAFTEGASYWDWDPSGRYLVLGVDNVEHPETVIKYTKVNPVTLRRKSFYSSQNQIQGIESLSKKVLAKSVVDWILYRQGSINEGEVFFRSNGTAFLQTSCYRNTVLIASTVNGKVYREVQIPRGYSLRQFHNGDWWEIGSHSSRSAFNWRTGKQVELK
jgi:hypothetical protein